VEPLTDGLRNANFKVLLEDRPDAIVVRIYEHDRSLCAKEMDILRLVRDGVPVPQVIHAEPDGLDDLPPFAVLGFVQAIGFRELKRSGDCEAIAQAARSAGEVLAAISQFRFDRCGWIGSGLHVGDPLLHGADPVPRFVDLCLASPNLQVRVEPDLRGRIHRYVWHWAPRLAELDNEGCLVHCDFGGRNLLVNKERGDWTIAAVLDWEFAVSGSPLVDIGHFLRYECASRPVCEPHFSNAFAGAGGKLPPDWRPLARVMDMTALCESLTREVLPDDIARELVELVAATVEQRDPME
jgi:aminoglycoside phosphotransferase (APT) family kinase protein